MEKEQNNNLEENKAKKSDVKQVTNKLAKKKKPNRWAWPIKILVVTLFLSLAFSVLSEFILDKVGIVVSILIILVLWFLGVITDMIGVATASCNIEPFNAMSSRKVRGAREARFLVKNAEKVSSICNDVVGDICGILSGAAGAVIAVKLITENMNNSIQILIASSVSAIIAGLTIFGKAMMKKVAIDNNTKIVLTVGKFLSLFTKKPKNKN